jgi:hypothetical protein
VTLAALALGILIGLLVAGNTKTTQHNNRPARDTPPVT